MKKRTGKQNTLIFTDVTIIDTAGGPNQTDMTVVITKDRITGIDKAGKLPSPKGAQTIDATGKFLIPGLWDMHAHRGDKRFLPLFIANGITGVRILWGSSVHHAWRKEVAKGSLLGPRLIIASSLVDGAKQFWPGSTSVRNEAEARQVVRQAKEDGADFIKIYESLTRDVFFAIADESKKQGIPFAGHIPWSVSATEV